MNDQVVPEMRGFERQSDAISLYVELLKSCLLDIIYADDPLANFVLYNRSPNTRFWKKWGINFLEKLLYRHQLRLVEPHVARLLGDPAKLTKSSLSNLREYGRDWPARAHTMIGKKRMDNLQACTEAVIRERIPGDLIETGVWRGGACIFMRGILKAYDDRTRTVWIADSFIGLPKPDAANYEADIGDLHHTQNDVLGVSRQQVEANFGRYGLLDEQVRFLEGWFKDTLPSAPIEKLAIIRLDGDMYESTIQALQALYHKLSPGGFVIIDDYFLPPCAKAVQDFRERHNINDEIHDIDGSAKYWRRAF